MSHRVSGGGSHTDSAEQTTLSVGISEKSGSGWLGRHRPKVLSLSTSQTVSLHSFPYHPTNTVFRALRERAEQRPCRRGAYILLGERRRHCSRQISHRVPGCEKCKIELRGGRQPCRYPEKHGTPRASAAAGGGVWDGRRSEAAGPGPDGRALAGAVVGNLGPVLKEAREGLTRRVS